MEDKEERDSDKDNNNKDSTVNQNKNDSEIKDNQPKEEKSNKKEQHQPHFQSNTEPVDQKKSKPKDSELTFEYLNTFLLKSKFISSPLSDSHRICLEFPSVDFNYSKNDLDSTSKKDIFKLESSLYKTDINTSTFYSLFKSLDQKEQYSFEDFKILIQIFSSIFSAFNDDLFKFDLSQDLFAPNHQRIVLLTFTDSELKQAYTERIGKVYQLLSSLSSTDGDVTIRNLLMLFSVFTLFGNISYRTFSIDNYLRNLDAYNKIVISDFKLFLLIHFHVIILFNLTLKKNSIDQMLQSKSKSKKVLQQELLNEIIPSLYYLDNYTADQLLQPNYQSVIMSTALKLNLLCYFNKVNLGIKLNINVLSFDSIKYINNNLKTCEGQLIMDDGLLLNLDKVIFIMSHFYINDFNIHFNYSFGMAVVSTILGAYFPIITLAKAFNANSLWVNRPQDMAIRHDNHEFIGQRNRLLSYNDYLSELDMLLGVLRFNYRLKKAKNKSKSLSKSYWFNFSFNSFSIMTKKELPPNTKHLRDIVITFNQQLFAEEDFVDAFSQPEGLLNFYTEMTKIINELRHFSKYLIGIRLCQNTINNKQLEYYFGLISLMLQYYVHDQLNKQNNIAFAETDFIKPQTTLLINNSLKQKDKINHYKHYAKKYEGEFAISFSALMSSLIELFGEILIHTIKNKKGQFNPKVLLRCFTENTLMIIKEDSSGLIDLIVYLHEGDKARPHHTKIADWIEKVKQSASIINSIQSIKVIMRMKYIGDKSNNSNAIDYIRMILPNVSSLYLIDTKCDLILQEKKAMIHLNPTEDKSDSFSLEMGNSQWKIFIDVMEQCYDVLQYLFDNKIKAYDNLTYVSNKKLLFQFKNGSLNVKKITLNSYDSILNVNFLHEDYSYPLAQIVSDEAIKNDYSLEKLLKLFKEHFYQKLDITEKEIKTILHNKLLKDKYAQRTLVIFKEQMCSLIKEELPIESFGHFRFFPVSLTKKEKTKIEYPVENKAKDVIAFEVGDAQNNFYSQNDIGTLFSITKTMPLLDKLVSDGQLVQSENESSVVKLYIVKHEKLANEIKAHKQAKLKGIKDKQDIKQKENKDMQFQIVNDKNEDSSKEKSEQKPIQNSSYKDKCIII